MDRKEFLQACTGAACACAASCLPAGAEPAKEDWRWGFLQRRYAKLLGLLSETMDEKKLAETLFKLGTYCSAEYDEATAKFRGDVAGFAEHMRKTSSGDFVEVDAKTGVVTMTSPDRTDCFCPLNGVAAKTPGVVCNCSLGWQTHTWETVLGKKVHVELKEAVLRGGKRCIFEIRRVEKA
ncbi:MAG TPA: hypothetical protein VMU01_10540 [Rhizomicrobium sp.]|nr:hypothetical protein [Rhizomicrobium sp.]